MTRNADKPFMLAVRHRLRETADGKSICVWVLNNAYINRLVMK
jgi:hypothetical protein